MPLRGGVATDFAERLRQRGIGTLSLDRSASPESLCAAIAWLAIDSVTTDDAAVRCAEPPPLPGLTIGRIAYGRLALGTEPSAEHTTNAAIWRAIASVALLDEDDAGGGGGAHDTLGDAEPVAVAGAIERRLPHEGYARRVAFVLLRVADQVAHAPPSQRAVLGERLRGVLGALRASSVGTIIKSTGVGADQRRFISQMIDALPVGAIIEWLETAAQANGQDLSHHLLRLLAKLSTRTQVADAPPDAAGSFRETARDLVRGWALDDPNPTANVSLLDQISRFDGTRVVQELPDSGAGRILQMALEVDEFGEDAQDAAHQLLGEGRTAELLQWAAEAPGRAAAAALHALVVSPAALKATLLREPLDQGVARTLLASLDASAVDALLDVLCDAKGRTTRRLVYDRLREYGPSLAPQLTRRLNGAPWYFVRNLLALMRDTSISDGGASDVAGTTLFRFLDHQHEQVRVEALRLLVAEPSARDQAIRHALDDASERVVRVAIELVGTEEGPERRGALAPELVQRLLRFIEAGEHAEDLRAGAVRALADAAPGIVVRDPLLSIATRRTLVLRRLVLVEARPLVLAALEVLATRYARDARTAPVLTLASRHHDPRIRNTVKDAALRASAA